MERGCTTFLARILTTREQLLLWQLDVPSGGEVTTPAEATESSIDGQTEVAMEMLSEDRAAVEASRRIPSF